MSAPDFNKDPWKHPAVWQSHAVRMTREENAGVEISVATCECGWAICARAQRGRVDFVARDDAVHEHWLSIVAEAEAVPA